MDLPGRDSAAERLAREVDGGEVRIPRDVARRIQLDPETHRDDADRFREVRTLRSGRPDVCSGPAVSSVGNVSREIL